MNCATFFSALTEVNDGELERLSSLWAPGSISRLALVQYAGPHLQAILAGLVPDTLETVRYFQTRVFVAIPEGEPATAGSFVQAGARLEYIRRVSKGATLAGLSASVNQGARCFVRVRTEVLLSVGCDEPFGRVPKWPLSISPGVLPRPRASFTIASEDVAAYSEVSGDNNPIHAVPSGELGTSSVLCHGMHVLGIAVSELCPDLVGTCFTAQFVAPVQSGSKQQIFGSAHNGDGNQSFYLIDEKGASKTVRRGMIWKIEGSNMSAFVRMTEPDEMEGARFVGHLESQDQMIESMPPTDDLLVALAWARTRSDRVFVTLFGMTGLGTADRYWAGSADRPAAVAVLPAQLERSDPWNWS